MIKSYRISDVDCAACAAKIEHKISKIKGVESAVLSFMSKKLTVEFENDNAEELFGEILKVCRKVCPECTLTER